MTSQDNRKAELLANPVEHFDITKFDARPVIDALNPQLRRGRTPPGMPDYAVRIPAGRRDAFSRRFPQLRAEWDDYDAYVVKHGERFEDIATEFGVSRTRLRSLNGIDSEAEVHGGTTLVVPKVSQETRSKNRERAFDNLHAAGVPQGKPGDKLIVALPDPHTKVANKRRVFYRVVSGDSLYGIANTFGVDRHQLARWNGLVPDARVHARMILQAWVNHDFDASAANVKLLDESRITLVKSGSEQHIELAETLLGRERIVYTADKTESFEAIGKKFGLSHRSLARINRMSPFTVLKPGQQIVVYKVVDPSASERAAEQHNNAKRAARQSRRRGRR